MAFNTCRVCPAVIPPCGVCNSGQTCVIIAQSCHVCSYTECLDNAQVSSGHYTIGSTAVISLSNTINPGGPISSPVSGSQDSTASTTSGTTLPSSSSGSSSTTAIAVSTTNSPSTSASSMAASSSDIAISNSLSSIASSLSTQASSVTNSPTSTPNTGAAATIGPQAMGAQGLLWVVMAFWLGTAVFGGRRWRL
ncbi:MAG: hypothetical protein GOMPHAMPRED_003966 [Gomphillus americanus]|uniref:Membrane anchor Opy2 N-terminal domain-containing protein n=1 Tax=Gomphillus americanus TaxID=1940652 RepID=A0A8H3FII7_9LECA|nr:MAG: hypothetical protein GOMPHAMPRED_003966 [Gomphillus americanus]